MKIKKHFIGIALLVFCMPITASSKLEMKSSNGNMAQSAQQNETDQKAEAIKAADKAYLQMESVTDLSNLANSPNLIAEAKKLTQGSDFIQKDFRIKVPLNGVVFGNDPSAADPNTCFATLEVVNFGTDGKTVMLTLNIASELVTTICISGNNANLGPGVDSGNDIFFAKRGNVSSVQDLFASLIRKDGMWLALLMNMKGAISDFYRGQTRSEVESKCSELGLSQFKETGKTAKYTICSLYWVDMQKQYDIFGNYNYQMRNDKKYGDFYFGAQGRLMKWILFM